MSDKLIARRSALRLLARRLATCLVLLPAALVSVAAAQIAFEDATPGSGILHDGESYGVSWGDLNADGWPDLFVNNHRDAPALLVNMGNGTFVDRNLEVATWAAFPNLDQHGAAWGDFNNDGFDDLFVALGATDDLQFLVNSGGVLFDETVAYGLDAYTSWPGRLPVWLDYDADGWLDFVMMLRGFPKIFRQDAGAWVDVKPLVGISCQDAQYGQLADIDADGTLDLVCDNQTLWPYAAYDTTTIPFTDITSLIPRQESVVDTALGDFDNNLRNDIFAVRGGLRLSEAVQTDADSIEAQFIVDSGSEEYMRFQTAGIVTFLMDWNRRDKSRIFIGAGGYNPDGFGPNDPISFDLDPANAANWGIKPHDPTVEDGVWIGYDDATGYWEVQTSSGLLLNITYWFVDSTAPITAFESGGLGGGEFPIGPKLLMNYSTGLAEEAGARGIATRIRCVSAVAGDFDNDMDQDIYIVCRNGISNSANILYENLGSGNFQAVPLAGGAEGPVGMEVGQGENVAIADYDVDGFLDLFVTNGLNIYPEPPRFASRGGPEQLFRNLGNSNSWIELDLVGGPSNKPAIGAKVYATAGGVTQLREQNGGYHRWAQNHQRLHFGLGANSVVDLTIEWPSGNVDTYTGVPANALYRVIEGDNYAPVGLSEVPPSECGEPAVNSATDAGFFLYRDCVTDEWHVLVTAANDYAGFVGKFISDQSFVSVTALDLESHDTLDTSDPTVIDFFVQTWGTGRDEFKFQFLPGAEVCLVIEAPAGTSTVSLGSARVPVGVPLDLNTLSACTTLPATIAVDDVTVDETAGTATFTVSIDAVNAQTVSVDYTTVNGSAVAPDDYVAKSGTVTFLPGQTSQPVNVTINDDTLGETDESFSLVLSNPVNGSIGDATGIATINDDEPSVCGDPLVVGNADGGLFAWRECATGVWHVELGAGGAYGLVFGKVTSDQALLNINPVGMEPHDSFDTSNPYRIDFVAQVWASGVDEFTFETAPGAAICLELSQRFPNSVLVGEDRSPILLPVDLGTLSACTNLIADVSVGNVSVDEDAGIAVFTVSLDAPNAQPVEVDYTTNDVTAAASGDYLATSGTLVFATGQTTKQVSVVINDDFEGETDETFELLLSNPVNGVIVSGTGTATIADNEVSACDAPVINAASDKELFVWKDCINGVWHVQATAGGTYTNYTGAITSTADIVSLTPMDIEAHDTLDNTTSADTIDFVLQIWNTGDDEFTFVPAPGASACLTLDLPAGKQALVGGGRTPYSLPLDLRTLGACDNLIVDAAVDDISVGEAAGTAQFAVTLAQPSTATVTVDYQTAGLSATQGSDFLPATGTVTFLPGETTQPVSVTLVDDNVGEGDETFTVTLSNPVNALLADAIGVATITDNEISPCGRPAYDAAAEAQIFVWKDCAADTWYVTTTAGGVYANFIGQVSSDQALQNITAVDIEAHDVVNTTVATAVSFNLKMWTTGVDEFSFRVAPGAQVCLQLTTPVGQNLLYGAGRVPSTTPVELQTFSACTL